ncbi:MAG TPA: carbohydrate-binding family V/XII, partial [Candidatus Krumholzibacteria bacterium]|nr:carbohydrate-binding family V/XII [Candidatus Krumholzibacteria bacterium]
MRTFARIVTFALATAMLFAASSSFAQKSDGTWPRVIQNAIATVTVYQPQIESFNDVTLEARAAVSVKAPKKDPVFGAVWFHARTTVDKQARIVTLDSTMVTQMKFPNATPEQEGWLKSVINAEIPNWGRTLSYDVLVSQLANVEQEQAASAKLNNAPPAIIYVTTPTVLIMIDGEPKYKDVEGGLKVVGNTPYFIVQDGATKYWYLKGRESWYSGQDVMGPWSAMTGSAPPQSVQDLAAKTVSTPPDSLKEEGKPTIPAVIVRTKPAEIIQTDGEPKFEPVKGTNLLYVKNSEDDIIMDIDSQQYYVLVAGRWYTTKSISGGPWTYVPGDQLPKDFPSIPGESDLADVLANVPGTTEAKEAVLENSIPQTAAVDRKTANLDVKYDGQPKFEAITGTKMSYAVNTDKSVLLISGRYYCCDQAIWFEASGPSGPWTTSTKVPDDVQSIPPECPVYNVKYVYIYEATPEVVYEGYTPAYTGSYVYNGCVVYGTGYYYAPWYGAYYYPRPVTYGFAVHYNPWTGWGFSVGISYGWMSVSFGGYGGYWGAGGYGYGYRHGYGHGYNHGYNNGYRHGFGAGYVAGKNQGNRPAQYSRNNYQNRQGVKSTARPEQMPANGSRVKPSKQPNNVYADRNGNV